MKINNKGFTIIETMASFILVTFVAFGLLQLLMTYKNKSAIEMEKNEYVTLRETITKIIQSDVATKGLKSITRTVAGDTLMFNFADGTTSNFRVNNVSTGLNNDLVRNKYYEYNGIKYRIPTGIPDTLASSCAATQNNPKTCAKNYQSVNIDVSNILTVDTVGCGTKTGANFNDTCTVYTIDVKMAVDDLDEDYGLHMVFMSKTAEQGEIVDSGNLMSNSSFEAWDNITNKYHYATDGTIVSLAVSPFDQGIMNSYSGRKSLLLDCPEKPGVERDCYVYLKDQIHVEPEKTYTISFYYASAIDLSKDPNATFKTSSYWQMLDSNKSYVGDMLSFTNVNKPSEPMTNTYKEWRRVSLTWTAPANVHYIWPRFGLKSTKYAWMVVDGIQVIEGTAPTAYYPN